MLDQQREFLKKIKSNLTSEDYDTRSWANLAILGYDLGRSVSEINTKNASHQYEIRFWAFVQQEGIKEGTRLARRYR